MLVEKGESPVIDDQYMRVLLPLLITGGEGLESRHSADWVRSQPGGLASGSKFEKTMSRLELPPREERESPRMSFSRCL